MKKLLFTTTLALSSVFAHASNAGAPFSTAIAPFLEGVSVGYPVFPVASAIGQVPDYLGLLEERHALREVDAQHGAAIGGLGDRSALDAVLGVTLKAVPAKTLAHEHLKAGPHGQPRAAARQ